MATTLLMIATVQAGDWRWAGGAELNASPHGILDLGWRSDSWSIELLTDTIDARHQAELSRGKAWGAARLELGSAGLISSPWAEGAPDTDRAMMASYAGIEGGWQRYLSGGMYAGIEGFARQYVLTSASTTWAAGRRALGMGQGVLGWWRPEVQLRLAAGSHLAPDSTALLAPHLIFQGRYQPSWSLAPRLEVYAGLARGQDLLSRTRLGGLNPYVVPLAGAGWAEWWVEDYAAVRLGPMLQRERAKIGVVLDAAWFDGQSAVGLGTPLRVNGERWYVEAAAGYAPWIERQDDVGRWSVLLCVGQDWG